MTAPITPARYFPSLTPRNIPALSYSSAMQVDDDGDDRNDKNSDSDDLVALNAKIAILQAQLAVLQTKRHALIQRHILRALTPPSDDKPSLPLVTRLAPELLGYIFELALAADQNSILSLPSNAVLLSISKVCKRWRSIAHSTPQLWMNITLTAPSTNSVLSLSSSSSSLDSIVCLLSLLTNRIRRSGALPFHLYILDSSSTNNDIRKHEVHANDLSSYTQNALFQETIQTLYDNLDRCRFIRVDEGMTGVWNLLFSGLRSMPAPLIASNLHTILISYAIPVPRLTVGAILHSLDLTSGKLQLPSLHTLSITSPMAIPTLSGFSIDYSQLRILKWRSRGSFYGPPGFTALTAVLAQCVQLEECEIDRLPTTHRTPSYVIILPKLKKLDIKFTLSDDPGVLLSIIHAPELQELLLEQTSPISHVLGLSGAVAGFLRAADAISNSGHSVPSSHLRSLTLSGLILKESDVPLFQALDNIRSSHTDLELKLTFDRCFLHDSFVLQMLGIPASSEPVESAGNSSSPPRLTNLTFNSTAFNHRLLYDAIQNRDRFQVRIL